MNENEVFLQEAISNLNNLSEEYLSEMANVSKSDTKLKYDLWIDSDGINRNVPHNLPRLKVDVDGDRIPVSISDDPKVLVSGKKIPNEAEVLEYIRKYKDILLKHWNKEITDRQALNALGEK